MKIKVELNNVFVDFPCALCGNYYQADSAIATLHNDDNKSLGDVCPQCIEAGLDGIKDRIRGRIEYLQSHIEWLKSILNQDLDILPTVEEWQQFEEQCDRELMND